MKDSNNVTVEVEATNKFIDVLLTVNKHIDKDFIFNILTTKVKLDTNRDIHQYVKSTIQLSKAVKPILKHNAPKLNHLGDKVLIPRDSEIVKAINTIQLKCSNSKDSLIKYILNNLN